MRKIKRGTTNIQDGRKLGHDAKEQEKARKVKGRDPVSPAKEPVFHISTVGSKMFFEQKRYLLTDLCSER